MEIQSTTESHARRNELNRVLEHERAFALERVRGLRARQDERDWHALADELDSARSLADLATQLALIERAEERLRAIDVAFARLSRGLYGICPRCGDEIALERLKAVPFAAYCVDCQEKRSVKRSSAKN